MKHYIKVLKPQLSEIECDFCHKKWKREDWQGCMDAKMYFGYPSDFDTDLYGFDVCDNCFKEHFNIIIKNIKPEETY